MPNKDNRTKPYLTFSNAWTAEGYEADKDDGKPLKTLESPFSNTDDGDAEKRNK